MSGLTYLLRSLFFHRRVNLGVLLGAALASTVLTGALMVGDSVRHSLERMTFSRLGGAETVLVAGGHFFRADLADRMGSAPGMEAAPVLLLSGVALSPEGDRRINDVQVVGVDERFARFAPDPSAVPGLEPDRVWVNAVFSARMAAEEGDAFVLRVRRPGGLPAEVTLAPREGSIWSRRIRIGRVVGPDAFGHFSLRSTQAPPPTVFIPLSRLGEELEIAGRANVLLLRHAPGTPLESLEKRLAEQWSLSDAGLSIDRLPSGSLELRSDRVFIEPAVADAARAIDPDAQAVITYLVNSIEHESRSIPYAFASAPGPPRVPHSADDDAAWVSDWVAEDLGLSPGHRITIRYYAVDSGRRLEERAASFSVAGIVDTASVAEQDRRLAPHIPGLSDAEHCRDWDPGIPIDLERIRDRDEAYWNAYGPTPKLYLTFAAAERLWSNRYGTATAFRFPASTGADDLGQALRERLHPRDLGFEFRAALDEGLAASREAVDFGHLFIGLSFFLIAGALLLTALLFAFNVEYRSGETGTLRALGFRPVTIRRWFWMEGCLLVVVGAVAGAFLAVGYNRAVLHALATIWSDAVRMSEFRMIIRPASLGIGVATVVLVALLGIGWVLRGQSRATIRALQQGVPEREPARSSGRAMLAAGWVGLAAAIAGVVMAPAGQDRAAAGIFFGAGALLLVSVLLLWNGSMLRRARRRRDGPLTMTGLMVQGLVLRRGRSLACVALLALGVFLVMAVAANRRGPVRDAGERASGTGGYAIWGQTTLPVTMEPHGEETGFAREPVVSEARVEMLRLREGDDASCLNLNRVTRPHLLGVRPETFSRRGAFTVARMVEGVDPADPWRILAEDLGPDTIPAMADQGDITWGLGLAVGDTLPFTDEAGRVFRVRLMAGLSRSIFQGHLLVAEQHLAERFPSQSGLRVMLIDTPAGTEEALLAGLTRRGSDVGWAGTRTEQRLAEFNSVENTYLSIFMLLGGLGILVGSAGMGIVAARNILERRGELALLRAVGFRARHVRRLIFLEHGLLAAAGVCTGSLAALLAAAPALLAPGARIPWSGVAVTFGLVMAGSMVWIAAAVHGALRGDVLAALRNE